MFCWFRLLKRKDFLLVCFYLVWLRSDVPPSPRSLGQHTAKNNGLRVGSGCQSRNMFGPWYEALSQPIVNTTARPKLVQYRTNQRFSTGTRYKFDWNLPNHINHSFHTWPQQWGYLTQIFIHILINISILFIQSSLYNSILLPNYSLSLIQQLQATKRRCWRAVNYM